MIELGELEAHHQEFADRHTRVVAVSVDDLEHAKETQQKFPNLIIVADPDQKLIAAAEVLHPHAGQHGEDVAAPTTIFVDKHGMVRSLYRPAQVITRLSAKDVLEMVDKDLSAAK
jgi:peroxiredoxin